MNSKNANLAHLANMRWLPSVFDQSWEKRTGVNPVALVIDRLTYELASKREAIAPFLTGLVIIATGLMSAFCLTFGNLRTALAFDACIGIACICFAFLRMGHNIPLSEEYKSQIEAFSTDLQNFLVWSRIENPKDLRSFSEAKLREMADQILTSTARLILAYQDISTSSKVLMLVGKLNTDLALQYDTLTRLGLASGGYTRYYAEAKKKNDETDERLHVEKAMK
ncbi:MAG TPA: hypothetical protein VM103_00580 [Candidatus Paceibacterota bacterium]|nr:hypothetical protein [Candidatus Paceibacterota bacterium]